MIYSLNEKQNKTEISAFALTITETEFISETEISLLVISLHLKPG